MNVQVKITPELDPRFMPAALWNKAYRAKVRDREDPVDVSIALVRPDETCSVYATQILPLSSRYASMSLRYIERILKFLLWQRGGCSVLIAGCDDLTNQLAAAYAPGGERGFDYSFFGDKTYLRPLEIRSCGMEGIPEANELAMPLGRHLDGCRIGFDLGGSDRKCAAVINGEVVFSEEVEWDPYFENDPTYHIEGINDTLQRAATHLPRVDAIGGSSAGVYVNNEVRVASLFRGVSDGDFGIKPENIHIPDGMADDVSGFCAAYEKAIEDAGGIDLQVLGIGSDGHVGFNEPTSSFASRTRIKTLTQQTVVDNARFFDGDEVQVPRHCITMGIGTIMDARMNIMLAFGENKAEAVAASVEGPVASIMPASILQHHPRAKVFIDQAAAGDLKLADYYRWVYDGKPEWQQDA